MRETTDVASGRSGSKLPFLTVLSMCVDPIGQRNVLVDDAPEVLSPVDVVGAHGDPQGQRLGEIPVAVHQSLQNGAWGCGVK